MSPTDSSVTILIADDDQSMRDLLKAAVTQWGYNIVEASNGEEAWEIMQKPDAPRLLILDWLMPKLDGIDLCQRIREKLTFYPYIIFLTAVSGSANIIKGFEAGADEFLLKPVNFDELRTHVFAGERIIKYLITIENQKKQIESLTLQINKLQVQKEK